MILAFGLLLVGCDSTDEGRTSSPSQDGERWYEVVSQGPGLEVSDEVMRRKIEASGQPWKVRDRASGIEMVLVMPGEFLMGSSELEKGRNGDEGPQHRVRLTKAFYMGATEVTQGQWKEVMGSVTGFFRGERKPVDASFNDLQEFLGQVNGGLPVGLESMRLPTEAEWEYAARSGTKGAFSFAGPIGHDVLNFNDGDVESAVVVDGKLEVEWITPPAAECRMTTAVAGSLPPNAWGLHEMHGNLAEWTADKYLSDGYAGRGALTVDPIQQATGEDLRTLRGGDWYKGAKNSRSAVRDAGGPHTRSNRIGFRVARTL